MSVIARTAGIGRSAEELQWDLNYLLQLWRAIEDAAKLAAGAFLIYQESSLVIRAIRDYFQPDIGELLIDTEAIFEQAQQFMSHVMPANVQRVKLYKDDVPLFSRFQIEHQIETAYARQVPLPSGGAIVVDHTEALVAVDVNSARATRGSDIETTAFNTNLEAAEEIARQLRLRDLGGLIVIDFIDMESAKNQRDVETRLKEAMRYDRARIQLGKISRFGLMELSRQRLRPALAESAYIACPRCHGIGHIRGTESTALHILRILQEEAMKENTAQVIAQVPVDVATFLLNEKRTEVLSIETRFKVNLLLVPNRHLETPNYKVQRLRHDDLNQSEPLPASFNLVEQPEELDPAKALQEEAKEPRQEAMVKGITPAQPAPLPADAAPAAPSTVPPPARIGWLGRLRAWLAGHRQPALPAPPPAPPAAVEKERASDARREARDARGGERNRGQSRGEHRDSRRGETQGRDARRDQRREGERQAARDGGAASVRPSPLVAADRRREPQPGREGQAQREGQPQREPRPPREKREPRESQPPREPREPRERREGRPPREPRGAGSGDRTPPVGEAGDSAILREGQPVGAEAEGGDGGSRRRRDRRQRGERADTGEKPSAPAAAPAAPVAEPAHAAANVAVATGEQRASPAASEPANAGEPVVASSVTPVPALAASVAELERYAVERIEAPPPGVAVGVAEDPPRSARAGTNAAAANAGSRGTGAAAGVWSRTGRDPVLSGARRGRAASACAARSPAAAGAHRGAAGVRRDPQGVSAGKLTTRPVRVRGRGEPGRSRPARGPLPRRRHLWQSSF